MPSFKFAGFVSGSLVALTVAQGAATAQAALTWGQPGGGGQPNAGLAIARVDQKANAELIAPCSVFLKATSYSGFNVTEPSGDTNVYDPTQHRMTHIWDFGDPGYARRFTPNIPTVWRDTNLAYGKAVAHVFAASGNYTVTCFAFDEAGNWGIATYTFQAGGNAGPIRSQAEAFQNAATVCYDPDGPANGWAGAPAGASLQTTISGANTALTNAGSSARLLLRRGRSYTFTGLGLEKRDAQTLYVGAYGSGAEPGVTVGKNGWISFRGLVNGPCVLQDIDTEGGWDPTTETGVDGDMFGQNGNGLGMYCDELTFHRCRISGLGRLRHYEGPAGTRPAMRVFSDTIVTNWKDYGTIATAPLFACIGADWFQHPDALHGIDQGNSSQSDSNLGNTHGPIRGGIPRVGYIGSSAFFSNCGWALRSRLYTAAGGPPTEPQACIRLTDGVITFRNYFTMDRCSLEGGVNMWGYLPNGGTASQHANNFLHDKVLFVASPMTERFMQLASPGHTVRNCYFYRHNVAKEFPINVSDRMISLEVTNLPSTGGGHAFLATAPHRIHNCTGWIAGATSTIGTTVPVLVASPTGGPFTSENNVFFAPNLTLPLGTGQSGTPDFRPVGTTPIAGFVSRYKGSRWNFPPIGSVGETTPQAAPNVFDSDRGGWVRPVTAYREGGPGTVQNLEWVLLPYPNYSGLSGGALGVLNATICTANPARQKHQVSLMGVDPKRLGDQTIWPEANRGTDTGVRIQFTAGGIRIQNRTGFPWVATYVDGQNTKTNAIMLQLDLSDHLMASRSAFATPADVPAPVLGAGSAGIVANRNTGSWAHGGFLADYREGVKTPPSGATQIGKSHKQGAFA